MKQSCKPQHLLAHAQEVASVTSEISRVVMQIWCCKKLHRKKILVFLLFSFKEQNSIMSFEYDEI
uniref:Uncharacterized protein n=1 Tax=Rhizophora mucronata TaxID=61149 RepID=A0A2P2MUG6_RHIMU